MLKELPIVCTSVVLLCYCSVDGFRVIYDREVPFELRVQESADGPQQVGTLEAIKVKVLMLVSCANPVSIFMAKSTQLPEGYYCENVFYFHSVGQNCDDVPSVGRHRHSQTAIRLLLSEEERTQFSFRLYLLARLPVSCLLKATCRRPVLPTEFNSTFLYSLALGCQSVEC